MYILADVPNKEIDSQKPPETHCPRHFALRNCSSEQIIAGIRQGDSAYESEFYRRYHHRVISFLQSYTNHRSHAEDIAQNALIIVLVRLRSSGIENPAKLSAYVFQTAKYSYFGGLRSAANRYQSHVQLEDVDTGLDCIDTTIRQERRRLVNQLINRLEIPRDREILQRTYTYEEPKASICESLRLTSLHFDCVIDRARKRFRHLVESEKPEIRQALAHA